MRIDRAAAVLCALVCSVSASIAQSKLDLQGFEPGESLEEAQEHAGRANLHLKEIAALPGTWAVEGTNLTLSVCSGMVASVGIDIEGGVDEFGELVSIWQGEFGAPEVQVVSLDAGAMRITNIDARFSDEQGAHLVQLHSYDGEVGISAFAGSTIECPKTAP